MSAGKISKRRGTSEMDRRSWLRRAVAGRGGVRLPRWRLGPGIAAEDIKLSPENRPGKSWSVPKRASGPSRAGRS